MCGHFVVLPLRRFVGFNSHSFDFGSAPSTIDMVTNSWCIQKIYKRYPRSGSKRNFPSSYFWCIRSFLSKKSLSALIQEFPEGSRWKNLPQVQRGRVSKPVGLSECSTNCLHVWNTNLVFLFPLSSQPCCEHLTAFQHPFVIFRNWNWTQFDICCWKVENITIWFGSISSVCICILLYMTIPWQGQLVKCCISDICNLHPVQVICNLYSASGPDRWKISPPGLFSSALLKSWSGIWWKCLAQIPRNSYSWSETLRLRATRQMFFVLRVAFISSATCEYFAQSQHLRC